MPWTIKDVDDHKKGLTDEQKKAWVKAANAALASCLEEDGEQAKCDASAIRIANAAVDKVEESEKPLREMWGDYYRPYVPIAVTSFADLDAQEQAQEAAQTLSMRAGQLGSLIYNILDSETEDKPSALRVIFDEFLAIVGDTVSDMDQASESAYAKLNKDLQVLSVLGNVDPDTIPLAEVDRDRLDLSNPRRMPVLLDVAIMRAGAGNEHDHNYYPAEVIERDGSVFEGVDIFETDHKPEEVGEKTKVGRIREVSGMLDDSLIGRAVIYDPDLAEKTRNRADAGELATMHFSILAYGTAKKGEVDGEAYNILESIVSAKSVDLVSRAGAGGHAIALSEMENDMKKKKPVEPVDDETLVQEKESEQGPQPVTIQESDTKTPTQEQEPAQTETPTVMTAEQVNETLTEVDLPDGARVWVTRGQYTSVEEVKAAVAEMETLLASIADAGKPFAMGETASPANDPTMPKLLTLEELEQQKRSRFSTIMAGIDPNYTANYG